MSGELGSVLGACKGRILHRVTLEVDARTARLEMDGLSLVFRGIVSTNLMGPWDGQGTTVEHVRLVEEDAEVGCYEIRLISGVPRTYRIVSQAPEVIRTNSGSTGSPPDLAGVIAARSRISFVDGARGVLEYAGYPVQELCRSVSFEDVCLLLRNGELPGPDQSAEFRQRIRKHRAVPDRMLALLRCCPKAAPPLDVLRTAVSFYGTNEGTDNDDSPDAGEWLIAQLPAITAAFVRMRQGLDPVIPRADLGHAAHLLYSLTGEEPDPAAAEVLEATLVLHQDHAMNPSTFSARVTTSTGADLFAAVTSALATLKGQTHGGANQAVLRMFHEIGDPARARTWVAEALSKRQRIIGFGHPIYRVRDPRAVVLAELSRELVAGAAGSRWLEIAFEVEAAMAEWREQSGKPIHANVDFYAAPTLAAVGIEEDVFPAIFAMARVPGWCAHVAEQSEHNRQVRPWLDYIGPARRELPR